MDASPDLFNAVVTVSSIALAAKNFTYRTRHDRALCQSLLHWGCTVSGFLAMLGALIGLALNHDGLAWLGFWASALMILSVVILVIEGARQEESTAREGSAAASTGLAE